MKKIFQLIKANFSEGMNLFKISTKKKNNFTKIFLPIIIALFLMGSIYSYAELIIQELEPVNMEFVLLTLFVILTSVLTLIEGIYKSGNLLFNCKDDNLLLSLPIKKRDVLFIRIFKFYIFELLYNSLFILPAIIVYAIHTTPNFTFYIVSIISIILLPIIPILLSCILGTLITFFSSMFKNGRLIQTILTFALLLGIIYISYNSDNIILNIAKNASSLNDIITKIYYPAGIYIELITKFSIIKLIEFIIIHIILFALTIVFVGKIYFNINSNVKSIKPSRSNKHYTIKSSTQVKSLIKKEFNRFINSTVFITNAGFGVVLFILACILLCIKYDDLANMLTSGENTVTLDYIKNCIPILLFGLICFSSFMTSITSSMISLEGKAFNILKSLPVKPYTIVKSKILAAILIIIPCILIGDSIVFIKFKFDILSIILILIASIIFPYLSETIGIIVNLKYPRMDAKNDTEVVKQSMSSAISVFIGIILSTITLFLLFVALNLNINNYIIISIFILAYSIIYALLYILLRKTCNKNFNNITI